MKNKSILSSPKTFVLSLLAVFGIITIFLLIINNIDLMVNRPNMPLATITNSYVATCPSKIDQTAQCDVVEGYFTPVYGTCEFQSDSPDAVLIRYSTKGEVFTEEGGKLEPNVVYTNTFIGDGDRMACVSNFYSNDHSVVDFTIIKLKD